MIVSAVAVSMVGATGLEPVSRKTSDFKSLAFASFATPPAGPNLVAARAAGKRGYGATSTGSPPWRRTSSEIASAAAVTSARSVPRTTRLTAGLPSRQTG